MTGRRMPVVNVDALLDGSWKAVLRNTAFSERPLGSRCRVETAGSTVRRAELYVRGEGECESAVRIEGVSDLESLGAALRAFGGSLNVPVEGDGRCFLDFGAHPAGRVHPETLAMSRPLGGPSIYLAGENAVLGYAMGNIAVVTDEETRVDGVVVVAGPFPFIALFDGGWLLTCRDAPREFCDFAVHAGDVGMSIYRCAGEAGVRAARIGTAGGRCGLDGLCSFIDTVTLERRDFLPAREGTVRAAPAAAFVAVTRLARRGRKAGGARWLPEREPPPAWMTASPFEWRLSLSVRFEFGNRESSGGVLGALCCVLPDLLDDPESLRLVTAPAAVGCADSVLRVHLGEQCWKVGWWEQCYPMLPGVKEDPDGEYGEEVCSDQDLADALGLTEKPTRARLAYWDGSRIMRNDKGEIVGSRKISPDRAVKASGKTGGH